MAYVSMGCKELKTTYIADTPEVNTQMNLVPTEMSLIPKRELVGIK